MLVRLTVRNYAIISELDLPFSDGLTIITGETGAGKSILIGALSLVLGKRADTSVLFNNKDKCVVEAHFDVSKFSLNDFFEDNDLDMEPITILRREINTSGKSRAFINDTPVNLNQLRELASRLIDIHSQHEVLSLKTPIFRAQFLDACADGGQTFAQFNSKYNEWSGLKKQAEHLKAQLQKAAADEDYLRFQLNELSELNLQEGEMESLQERLSMLENAEEIGRTVSSIVNVLSESESALVDALRGIESELSALSRKYPEAEKWRERVHANLVDLEDLSYDLSSSTSNLESDPEELQRLQERVDELFRLLSKHRKQSDSELIEMQQELEKQLNEIGSSDEKLTLVLAELEEAGAALEKQAQLLSQLRKEAASRLSPLISKELSELGMPDAELSIELQRTEIGALGQDEIEIKFSSNKGQQLQDISKVASGGELSRLMLSVKAQIAENAKLPAIIFDEIDTGVSGDVANKVGYKIKELSSNMQVFCITHLPQVAAKAQQHLFVYKELEEGKTVTKVRTLTENERITEIAKMLSSANPTEQALAHARNLVNETN